MHVELQEINEAVAFARLHEPSILQEIPASSPENCITITKKFMQHVLHISTSQSMCGNCGKQVSWGVFTPTCKYCGTTWKYVIRGWYMSGGTTTEYKNICQSMAPGLIYLDAQYLTLLTPRTGYLEEEWIIK
jgi:hypothetical protein